MLGKTANGLFWMYRYLERAENTARLLDTGQRIALTRSSDNSETWGPILQTAGIADSYYAAHYELAKDSVIDWMLRAPGNPASVLNSIQSARQNARLVRTALTHEVWEATNAAYMDAKSMLSRKVTERDLPGILAALRRNIALVRGATHGTMLRNEIYNFARIGTFLERADNTARILDVKYYVLLPSVTPIGSFVDNVQWESILRSVSARGGFRMEYGSAAGPMEIASFLILDSRMPRSLAFSVQKICENLSHLAPLDGSDLPAITLARTIKARYLTQDIEEVFDFGLHEFLQKLLGLIGDLAQQIEIDFRFYE